MKYLHILVTFFVLITSNLYSQIIETQVIDSIYDGELKIIRTDSSVLLKSELATLYLGKHHFGSVLYTDRKENRFISKELTQDSLVVLLCKKRYLAPDLLQKAYLSEKIEITKDGDTINRTNLKDTSVYYLWNISVNEFDRRKDRRHIYFRVNIARPLANYVDEHGYPIYWTPFSSFILVLKSTIKADEDRLLEFIEKSTFKYLYFDTEGIAI